MGIEHVRNMHMGKSAGAERFPAAGTVPLTMARVGESVSVQGIRGKDDTRRFLENLGFVEGTPVIVVSELGGNVIVNVKGTRVAISKVMASRILTN